MDFAITSSNKKYSKSKKGYNCIGPCYPKGTNILHPISLNIVHDDEDNFCPVKEHDNNNNLIEIDKCFNVTAINKTENKEITNDALSLIMPNIDFNIKTFLKVFYLIYSFEDGIEWISNHGTSPLNTKIRILKLSLDIYGNDINIIDNRGTDFFIHIMKKKYMNEFYSKLRKFIYIDKDNNVKLKQNIQEDSKEYRIIKMNYINEVFLIRNDVSKFIMRYLMSNKNNWFDKTNHLEQIINDCITSITNKVRIILLEK
jgi:hypothetical protein